MPRKKAIDNKDLRKEYSRLRSTANKRLKRAKASGLNTTAIKKNIHGFLKLTDIADNNVFKKELKRVEKFLRNRSQTTLSGNKQVYDRVYTTLTEGQKDIYTGELLARPLFDSDNFTKQDMKSFGTFMELTRAMNKDNTIGSPVAVMMYKAMYGDLRSTTKLSDNDILKKYARYLYEESTNKKEAANTIKEYAKKLGIRNEKSITKSGKGKLRTDEIRESIRNRLGTS